MHHLLLGRGGVLFGVGSFFGPLLWWRPNNKVVRSFLGSVARQRPASNNRKVFSFESVFRAHCRGTFVVLIQPELQNGEVVRCRHP
jgi:hypothetical protein